jgi:glycosyltransferase involved in cell wall biosynthesis
VYEKMKSILYAGTLNQRKGYADLIHAFSTIAARHPDWSIVLAGNGEVEQARELAIRLGIEKQVVLLGWVSGEAKDKAYKQAFAFCLPSYAEGFPMAVLDAWAYGLPVITTPVGGIPDIAKDGENLLLFNPGDIDALAKQLERIISDEALRKKISIESEWLAANTFSMANINHQVGELYEELSNK